MIENVIVYRATPDNEEFLGPADSHEALCHHILTASGPSGPNIEYVLNLHRALSQRQVVDPHIHRIVDTISNIGTSISIPSS